MSVVKRPTAAAESCLIPRRSVFASATLLLANWSSTFAGPPIEAIAFDAFPIFDPRSLVALGQSLLGDKGVALVDQWTAKLFGYTWLETAADRYEPFQSIAEAALRATGQDMRIALNDAVCRRLIAHYGELKPWPDVKPALETLRANRLRLALLSNLSLETLNENLQANQLAGYFEPPLSTDIVRQFKPSPKAYAMAMTAFGLPKDKIGFAAFGGWDAVGASWFGYRTAWINRLNAPVDPLDAAPQIVSQGIDGVLQLAGIT